MIICIVQLSDIHVKRESDQILKRGAKIASATLASCPKADADVLAFTGDLAFSGKAAQYELLTKFIGEVSDGRSPHRVLQFAIPGNHDLDFDREPDTRPTLLESIGKHLDKLDRSGETVKQILSVQRAFFKFETRLSGAEKSPFNQLFYTFRWDVEGKIIAVNCCNTAWLSRNPENPGQLLFPTQAVSSTLESTELAITAFHHPYNWLDPNNKRAFQNVVESISDVVLTGHEHESQIFFKESEIANNHYVEGAVLQEDKSGYSAFNCLVVDTEASEYRADLCIWDRDQYTRREGTTKPFVRNKNLKSVKFRIDSKFQEQLTALGMPLFHPYKSVVRLPDIFLYPSFRIARRGGKGQPTIIRSDKVFDYFRNAEHVLVLGEELSGRTSIAKTLFQDLLSKSELVPVFLRGDDFVGHREASVRATIRKRVKEQYEGDSSERFLQLPLDERVAIIDDWHAIKFSSKGQAAVIENLKAYFGKIICFTTWVYPLEQLADGGELRVSFADFDSATINQFGRALTGQFIEKWHFLGREYTLNPRQHDQDVIRSEGRIHDVVGQQMLPTYPWYLLSLLQADSQSNTSQSSGALVRTCL